jgi:hypothetical protein
MLPVLPRRRRVAPASSATRTPGAHPPDAPGCRRSFPLVRALLNPPVRASVTGPSDPAAATCGQHPGSCLSMCDLLCTRTVAADSPTGSRFLQSPSAEPTWSRTHSGHPLARITPAAHRAAVGHPQLDRTDLPPVDDVKPASDAWHRSSTRPTLPRSHPPPENACHRFMQQTLPTPHLQLHPES